ncbi:MAG: ABC transporter permease [Planctomycetota bacterium]|nr:ABC transporter permease [Planctomycetota bacterium]
MSKAMIIAFREFRETVMRPIFLLAVFGMPVVIIGIMALAIYVMATNEQPVLKGIIAVVDSSGEVAPAATMEFDAERIRSAEEQQVKDQLDETIESMESGNMPAISTQQPNQTAMRGLVEITIEDVRTVTDEEFESLKERIRNEDDELLAVVEINPDLLVQPDPDTPRKDRLRFDLFVGENVDSDHIDIIERQLGKAIVRVRAERAGYEPEQMVAMMRAPRSNTSRTLKEGGDAEESGGMRQLKKMIPMVFMMLIWIGVMTSAQHLMMTTIEEKSNRVMEVLLSAVSPFQLMTGKILGQGAVGLLIVTIYSSVAIVGLIISANMGLIDPMDLVYLVVFYLMAYFMIASMMAAVGSAVSDIREANTLVTPVMLVLMIPLMLWMPIIEAPNGNVATICSFVPPAIPFAMILRLAAEEPIPTWQIPVSIAWGYICVFGMIWGAGKIFRVGVLMYGKPPSPIELIKWLRYS